MKTNWRVFFLVLFGLGLGPSFATTFLQFDSTYLGDGWFQYKMHINKDPFFLEADVTQLSVNFTNQIDQSTTSSTWSNSGPDSTYSYSSWESSQGSSTRPYDAVFLMRSSETSYRLGTNVFDSAIVAFSLLLADYTPSFDGGVYSQNIVGFARMPCLIPCRPEDADGSPASFSYALKLLPDVNITSLIQSNGVVQGVDFLWDYESTFLLQASTDFNSWTNIAYIWSYPPETLWTTNRSLDDFGQFFQISLVASGHATNLPSLNSNVLLAKPAVAKTAIATTSTASRVSGCQVSGGKIAVKITTQANQNYTVSALDSHKTVRASQSLTATGDSASVCFDTKNLPSPVYFQVASTP
ncbi:MAG TPA: hypothetical protein VK815_15360 [Candidatus Acidoferrales bacterium]|jgi:hypothetical protein|nr:hypothetical protein [Candidatus Acidoferrales bacterium]